MKINSTYVWSNLVVVPVLFYIITYLFYRGNTDAYDYVDTYLSRSKVIKATIPKNTMINGGVTAFVLARKVVETTINLSSTPPSIKSIWLSYHSVVSTHLGKSTLKNLHEDFYIANSLQSLLMPILLSGTTRSMVRRIYRCRYSLSRPLTCTTTN